MRKLVFYLGYILGSKLVLEKYKKVQKYSGFTQEELQDYQFSKLKKYLIDAYEKTSYYKECFDEISFNPYNFNDTNELKKIPILTKKIINERKNDFYPSTPGIKYKTSKSGGSTGEPFEFRMGLDDAAWSRALLFNGFSYAGYKPGDKILTIAGGSLVKNKSSKKQRLMNFILNTETIPALNLKDESYKYILMRITKTKPKFIRGYSSSIYRVANYILESKIDIKYTPKGIFTTSETLEDSQRAIIEKAFKTTIYDQYGLNDSGASAFQIDKDKYLLDFERTFIELIPDDNSVRIIATSYSNDAMYFIRYDTGDNLEMTDEIMKNKIVAKRILGRASESLCINNNDVSVPRLTILLAEIETERYQILYNHNKIKFVYTGKLNDKDKVYVTDLFYGLFGKIELTFECINEKQFILTKNGKHKYVINQNKE